MEDGSLYVHIVQYTKITKSQLHGCSGSPPNVSICLVMEIQRNNNKRIKILKPTIIVFLLTYCI